jgi:outer membrane protein
VSKPLVTVGLLLAAVYSAAGQPATPVVIATSGSGEVPVKIATIFGQNAISGTQEGQKATQALNSRFSPQRDAFEHKQAELQSLRDQLKKGQATMSADERARLTREIDAKNKEAERLGEDVQAGLEQAEGALMQEMGDKMMAVIREYAGRNGLAVVVDISMPNGPVLWASPSIDITNEIVRLYDQAHPVSAAAPAAAPPKK